MEKLDLTKKYKSYYSAKTKPELTELGELSYISITGKGDPSGPAFADRVQALYSVAYAIKFHYKGEGKDFAVPKLEGQWWFDQEQYAGIGMAEAPKAVPRSEWLFRLLLMIPSYVSEQVIAAMTGSVAAKKALPLAKEVQFISLQEGKCIQLLHIGPFDREPESLQLIADFSQEQHLQQNGLHHEIYLSDFRKTAPEKLKTILREPVK